MRRLALILSLTLGLVACGGPPPAQKIDGWGGRAAADLTTARGTPTREVTDAGQRVLVYEEMVESRTRDLSQDTSKKNAGYLPPAPGTAGYSAYARSYLFWVDAAGKITQTQVREP